MTRLPNSEYAQQVAALPVRRSAGSGSLEVLLVTTRGTGRWVIPKGWPWPDLADHEAAAEEAREEAGVTGVTNAERFGSFAYGKRHKDGSVTPVQVDVYLLEVTDEHDSWPEQKYRQRQWFTPDEAAERVQESDLKAIIAALQPLP